MKKKLLALLSLFLAFVVFFSPFSCCLDKVSAAISVSLPSSPSYANNVDHTTYDNAFNALKSNPNFNSISSGYVFCGISGNQFYGVVLVPDSEFTNVRYATTNDILLYGDYASISCTISELPTYQLNFISVSSLPSSRPSSNVFNSVLYSTVLPFKFYITGAYLSNGSVSIGNSTNAMAIYPFNNAYVPDYNLLVGFPVGLDFSVEDFMNWLIDNDKISLSVDSGGASVGGKIPAYIGLSKLRSFLEFYKQFGSSNTSFVTRIWSWFSHMNIISQTNDNVVILKTTIDSLYREYINSYKQEFYSNSANQAHHRRNIQTQTDDDDLTLVTDDQTDDIYTKLLREIVRGIIALQVTVSEGHRAIIDTLNNLDFTVAVSNNGGDFKFPDLEELFSPTYSGFDDLEDQFFEKFPFLLDLQDLPEIEDYLEAEEQTDNLQVAALSSGSEAVEADPLKSRDDLFRFTVPVNNNFMNGAVSGMSIDFASFTKFAPAIEALKGIISVIALFGFSHWLIKFAPKLLHGYASSD